VTVAGMAATASKAVWEATGTATHDELLKFAANQVAVHVSTPCPGAPVSAMVPVVQEPDCVTVQPQEQAPAPTVGVPKTTCSLKPAGQESSVAL
jgi:hypothetical protein